MKIKPETLAILERSSVKGSILFLPPGQLERKLYEDVNRCLTSIGGQWDRRKGGHVFPADHDPADAVDQMILTGEFTDWKKTWQFFETPAELAMRIVELAEITEDVETVMEPSAGRGAIVLAIETAARSRDDLKMYLIEKNPELCAYLTDKGWYPACADFLEVEPMDDGNGLDRIVMNPPFSNGQDMRHVTHAFSLLKPGGRLVAIVSEGPFFRTTNAAVAFRGMVDMFGSSEELDEGTFKESGTMVKTRIVVLDKPKVAE